MDAFLIVALLAGFVAALATIVLVTRHIAAAPVQFRGEPMQTRPVPFPRRTVLFSKAERSLYQMLQTLVPDHMIFVKVKLADLALLQPRSMWDHFNPANRKHIDFIVCDPTLAPVVAIELDGLHAFGTSGDAVKSVLAQASLPLVSVPEKQGYALAELRQLLSPYLRVAGPML
jgi:Protein of unknown function (DUF2726)